MKSFKFSIVTILLFTIAMSCKKDFLDTDTGSLARQVYVKDLNSMGQFVNGIYIMLGSNMEFAYHSIYPELVADNIKLKSLTDNTLIPHYAWSQKADELDNGYRAGANTTATALNAMWKTGYFIARQCSFVIEDIGKYSSEDPTRADYMKGQAYAIRALAHFKLVNNFAQAYNYSTNGGHPGVPYITSSDISAPYSRQTVAQVYDNMIVDFKKAIELLPVTANDRRFMNRDAAKALLARIHLFKEDYTNAKSLAIELCNQIPLMKIAEGYPNNVFKFKAPAQTETIFQLAPQNASVNLRTQFSGWFLLGSVQRFLATNDIAGILTENANDARKVWVTGTPGNWSVSKFPLSSAPEITPVVSKVEAAYYHCIVRSSEMFLTAAEAAAKTNDEVNARLYLNVIRKRADPLIADVTATGQPLLDSIYKERRKELAFESLRMHDLQRWKKPVHRNDILNGFPTDLPYPSDKAIAPIPIQDVKLAGVPQNPGY